MSKSTDNLSMESLKGLVLAAEKQLVQADRSVMIQTMHLRSAEIQRETAMAEIEKWNELLYERWSERYNGVAA